MTRDMYGHLIHVSDRGLGGFGVSLSYGGTVEDVKAGRPARRPQFTFFHESDGYRQALFTVDAWQDPPETHPVWRRPKVVNIFHDRLIEVLELLSKGKQPMVLQYRYDDALSAHRLVCPEALDGCGALTDTDDEGRGNDWTCPMCDKGWNVHDAQQELNQLEEDAG